MKEKTAEDFPYWQTSQAAPDTWMEKARQEIERAGGRVLRDFFGSDMVSGAQAFRMEFQLDGDTFVILWPVLKPKSPKDGLGAKRQAATMLYHDVKARCVTARVLGARMSFCGYLALPDGRILGQMDDGALTRSVPELLATGHKLLPLAKEATR